MLRRDESSVRDSTRLHSLDNPETPARHASLSPHTAYSSAKFAIRGFTESLLVDLRTHAPHVAAVLVMPGHVRTGMPAPPRSWRRALNSLFADYQPVSSKQAANAILGSVSAGDWRVVIGQDAEAIDVRVRADPWSAYE